MPPRRDDDDELLAAYLDGVGELTPDERKRAEAARAALDPAEVAATRALIDQLRSVPPETAHEPDWAALESSIRDAVGERVPPPWWRRTWTWALPIAACAAAAIAIVALGAIGGGRTQPEATPAPIAHVEHLGMPAAPEPERAPMVYLDGEALDIDALDPAVLDEVQLPDIADEESLVPTDHWVDQLDDRALERTERVLANGKKG